jgi:hypothetical protein
MTCRLSAALGRSGRAIVVILAVLVVPTSAVASRCVTPRRASVVHATAEAAVTVEKQDGGDGSESRVWRGCSEQQGTQVELERGAWTSGGGHLARRFNLAGAVVGYLAEDWTKYESDTRLTVVNLNTGERWNTATVNTVNGSATGFTDLAVNRLGNAAWIRATYDRSGRREWRVFLWHRGKVSLRYRSRHSLTGLRLGSRRLQWRERGKVRVRLL